MNKKRLKFFGYRHTNGSFHLKRYLSDAGFDEALSSSFVAEVYGPFDAADSKSAATKFRELVVERS